MSQPSPYNFSKKTICTVPDVLRCLIKGDNTCACILGRKFRLLRQSHLYIRHVHSFSAWNPVYSYM